MPLDYASPPPTGRKQPRYDWRLRFHLVAATWLLHLLLPLLATWFRKDVPAAVAWLAYPLAFIPDGFVGDRPGFTWNRLASVNYALPYVLNSAAVAAMVLVVAELIYRVRRWGAPLER